MHALDITRQLATAIRETEEYKEYARLKEEIDADAGIKALLGNTGGCRRIYRCACFPVRAWKGRNPSGFSS